MSAFLARLRHPGRRLGAWWWTLRGRRRLRRGRVRGAILAYQEALSRSPDRFRTLLDLSIAYLCARDTVRAQTALRRARLRDPARFARRADALLGRWGFELPATTAPPRPRPVRQAARTREATPGRRRSPSNLPFGDCRDLDEYARFRAMPPISRAEIEALDWEQVIGDLFEE